MSDLNLGHLEPGTMLFMHRSANRSVAALKNAGILADRAREGGSPERMTYFIRAATHQLNLHHAADQDFKMASRQVKPAERLSRSKEFTQNAHMN